MYNVGLFLINTSVEISPKGSFEFRNFIVFEDYKIKTYIYINENTHIKTQSSHVYVGIKVAEYTKSRFPINSGNQRNF